MEDDKLKRKIEDVPVWSWKKTLAVVGFAIGYGLVLLFNFQANSFFIDPAGNNMALVAFLGVVPMVIGAISVYAIPPARRKPLTVVLVALGMTLLFLAVSLLMASGLFICVLMATPFLFAFAAIGALFSYIVKKLDQRYSSGKKKKRQYAFSGFVLILPILIAPMEARLQSPVWQRNVQDEIVIRGTAEAVWNNIIRMETIHPDEQRPSIYHTLGIPRPIKAELDYEGVGGVRIGYFEYGLTFVEEIIQWQPARLVRFSVDVQHNDQSTAVLKHIGGRYFDVVEAGYEIEQLDEEHVILRLDSDYILSTNFNGYGAFWSDWIMHDFQNYVLTTVKNRVEA